LAGQKIELKNIGLEFDIPSTGLGSVVKRLTFRYDEYDGYLNLRINRDFQPFENFDEFNGREVGGVAVSLINGVDHMGAIVLEGDIEDFAIGGEELWIDDVCLWY
jgi:hypothetical protein